MDAPGHVGQGELALLGGQGGVEDDLEQQVAQLLLQVVEAVPAVGLVQRPDGLQHLVGLLQQVAGEGRVGLLPVPRAALPQGADQLGEAGHLARHRRGQHRDVQRREVVGLDLPVEVVPGHGAHRLVGQPQAGQHHRRQPVGGLDRQLDVGQHRLGVALGHQQRPPLARRLDREPVPVDQPRPRRHRVDAQAGPGQVGERHARHQLDRHPGVGQQQLDRALGHQRRPRHGVQHLASAPRRRPPPPGPRRSPA